MLPNQTDVGGKSVQIYLMHAMSLSQYYYQWSGCGLQWWLPGYCGHWHIFGHRTSERHRQHQQFGGSYCQERRGKCQKRRAGWVNQIFVALCWIKYNLTELENSTVEPNFDTLILFLLSVCSQYTVSCNDIPQMPDVTFHIQGKEFTLPSSAFIRQVSVCFPCQSLYFLPSQHFPYIWISSP